MRPARGFRLLALVLLAGAAGLVTPTARAFSDTTGRVLESELGRAFGDPVVGSASVRSSHGLVPTAASTDIPSAATTRLDQWLEQLWWGVFALTASAYVLVLGALGIRRLRGAHAGRVGWAAPDVPLASARSRHLGPHL